MRNRSCALCSRRSAAAHGAADARGVRIGAVFLKKFGGFGVYRGTVVRDDGRSGWLVRYEDGDEEHLSERELLELMRAEVAVVPSDSSGSSGDDDVRGDWAAMDRSSADERAASDRSSRIDARRPPLAVCGRAASGGGGGEMRVGAAYSALTASFPSTLGMFASALLRAPANVAAPSAAASHAYAALTASFPSTVGMFASALPAPAAGGTRQGLTLAQRRAIASRARQQAPPLPPAADTSLAGLGRDLRRRAAGAVRPFVPTPDRPRGPLERQSGRQHNAQRTPVTGRTAARSGRLPARRAARGSSTGRMALGRCRVGHSVRGHCRWKRGADAPSGRQLCGRRPRRIAAARRAARRSARARPRPRRRPHSATRRTRARSSSQRIGPPESGALATRRHATPRCAGAAPAVAAAVGRACSSTGARLRRSCVRVACCQ